MTSRFYSLSRRREPLRLCGHLRCPLQLVPVEGPSINRPLHRLEQHQRKQLAIGKPLQPYMEQQPAIPFVSRMFPLQAEGQRRSNKIDDQERQKEGQQFLEVSRIGSLGVKVAVDQI